MAISHCHFQEGQNRGFTPRSPYYLVKKIQFLKIVVLRSLAPHKYNFINHIQIYLHNQMKQERMTIA